MNIVVFCSRLKNLIRKLNKNVEQCFHSQNHYKMTESNLKDDTITNKLKLYRTVNDRTLSEEYNIQSPRTKSKIEALSGVVPTSRVTTTSYSKIGQMENELKYMNSNIHERDVMAQYGIISMDYHNKYRNV